MFKYIIAAALFGLIITAAIIIFLGYYWAGNVKASQFILKDKAIVYHSLEEYRQFREALLNQDIVRQREIATEWIENNRVLLLPMQQMDILSQHPPILRVRLNNGVEVVTTISQIYDTHDGITWDILEQMIRGD